MQSIKVLRIDFIVFSPLKKPIYLIIGEKYLKYNIYQNFIFIFFKDYIKICYLASPWKICYTFLPVLRYKGG